MGIGSCISGLWVCNSILKFQRLQLKAIQSTSGIFCSKTTRNAGRESSDSVFGVSRALQDKHFEDLIR